MWRRLILPAFYLLGLVALAYLSYSFVDRSLILINQPWFIAWQTYRWRLADRPAELGNWFLLITTIVVLGYFGILRWLAGKNRHRWTIIMPIIGLAGLILILGHNAYSYDIYNYLFNAKMVVAYQSNPHVKVALDFAGDPWLRFMRNVHTPAPYGYGWTALSVAPFWLGFGKFLPAYLFMKLWMGLGLGLYLFFAWKLLKQIKTPDAFWRWAILAFNPLLLTETLLGGHNDVWMMWPVLAGWYLWRRSASAVKRFRLGPFLLSASLVLVSISVKWATVLLLPIFCLEWWEVFFPKALGYFRQYFADLAAVALLLPLVTDRSQQFHPWYLIWSLTFLPFLRWRWLKYTLLGLSISSLYRYLPWVTSAFEYTGEVEFTMRLITWSGAVVGLLIWLVGKIIPERK